MSLINSLINNKKLIHNFTSLTILQLTNYLFPLITFPYLVRVLGSEVYGLVSFAIAFVTYFIVLTDYGFNLSATQEISIHRNNENKKREIFSSVLIIKLGLFLLSGLLYSLIVLSFKKFQVDSDLYFLSFMLVLGSVLSPNWFFKGLEEMKIITIITFVVKVIWVISVFVFIKSEKDYLLFIILNGIAAILNGVLGILIIYFKYGVRLVFPTLSEIKHQLIEGWYLFASSASITLYTTSNIFILGLFAGNDIVGYFAAADKIRLAVQGLFENASQTIFPHLAKLFNESKAQAVSFVKKYIFIILSIAFILTFILLVFSRELILLVLGSSYLPALTVFRIIIFLPLIILLSNIFGIQVMLNLGYKKEFFKIIFLAGIINLLISFLVIPVYYEIGTALSIVISEVFVTAAFIHFVKKKKLLKLNII